jgi:hypothetical protein
MPPHSRPDQSLSLQAFRVGRLTVFFVGQKVTCVNDRNWPLASNFPGYTPTFPRKGAVYTVRAIALRIMRGYDEDGLHLEEIVNPVLTIKSDTGTRESELAFRMSRFRPLRATNIDVFLEMLEPVPAHATEQALVNFASWRAPPDMLTPAEIAALRREAKETSAYARRVFADLRQSQSARSHPSAQALLAGIMQAAGEREKDPALLDAGKRLAEVAQKGQSAAPERRWRANWLKGILGLVKRRRPS